MSYYYTYFDSARTKSSRYKLFNTIAIIRRRHFRAENYCAGRDHAEIRVVRHHGTRLLRPIGNYIILVLVFV